MVYQKHFKSIAEKLIIWILNHNLAVIFAARFMNHLCPA